MLLVEGCSPLASNLTWASIRGKGVAERKMWITSFKRAMCLGAIDIRKPRRRTLSQRRAMSASESQDGVLD